MLRAALPLLLALAACTPADPPLLIDEGKAPVAAGEQSEAAADGSSANRAADD